MEYPDSWRRSSDHVEVKPVLVTFLASLTMLLVVAVFSDVDAYLYAGCFPAAAVLTLKWHRTASMPRWLRVLLWAIVTVPLAALTVVVLATK
ncbi:hypothetical protein V1318_08495 [Lysobacter sp. CCNWLW3]|uniref:hypothetical protein n=1 Tax=unclassified Lysobacter TaxID=2635362 RepID=UPI002FCF2A28